MCSRVGKAIPEDFEETMDRMEERILSFFDSRLAGSSRLPLWDDLVESGDVIDHFVCVAR
jgi:hypothetical protein